MRVVVLGAGATSGTLANVGGVEGFIRRLAAVKPNWKSEYAALCTACEDCESPDNASLDELWTRLDYRSKFRTILGADYGKDAAIQVRKAIADAYSFTEEIDRLCAS